MPQFNETYFVLKRKNDGFLLRVECYSNNGGYACNESTVNFSESEYEPIYRGKFEDVLQAKIYDSRWYNSNEKRPCHRDVDLDEYDIVKVDEIIIRDERVVTLPKIKDINKIIQNGYFVDSKEKWADYIIKYKAFEDNIAEHHIIYFRPYCENQYLECIKKEGNMAYFKTRKLKDIGQLND